MNVGRLILRWEEMVREDWKDSILGKWLESSKSFYLALLRKQVHGCVRDSPNVSIDDKIRMV